MIPAGFIAVLSGLGIGGMIWALLRAMVAGSESYTATHARKTASQFEEIFLFIPSQRIAELSWICAVTSFLIVFLSVANYRVPVTMLIALALGGLTAILALQLPAQVLKFLRERRRRRFNLQLIDGLAHMSNALRAGFSIQQAFEAVVQSGENPIAQEFDVFLQQTRVGVGIGEALDNLDQRVGSEDLTLVVMSIETARRTGGNLTEIFDKISYTIRERLRIENRVRTLTAQGRLQGMVLGAMPVVIAVAMTMARPGLMVPFIHSSAGVITLGVVIVLVSLGGIAIRKIVRINV